MKELFLAIKARFKAEPHNDFYNLTGGRLYYDSAPQGTGYPYAVVVPVSAVNVDTFTARINSALVQISIYSARGSSEECWDICRAATEFMETNTFAVQGHADVRFVRNLEPLPRRGGEKLWAAHGDFRALVQRNQGE